MKSERLQLDTLTALRFPLIVGVVFIHSRFTDIITKEGAISICFENYPIYSFLSSLISNVFSRISVPMFFAISGYFFFYKRQDFCFHVYLQKLKRRVRTLLVPYFIWNFIVILILLLAEIFIPEMMSGLKKSVFKWNLYDWFENIYITPISYQFWFIRDLIILCVLSPIIYYGIKYVKLLFVIILAVLWIFNVWFDVPGFSIVGIFSFSLGAYFSIHNVVVTDFLAKHTLFLGIIYGVLSIIDVLMPASAWKFYYHNFNMLIGMSFVVALFARLIQNGYRVNNSFLAKKSFFIFAYHVMPLVLVLKLCFKVIPYDSEIFLIFIYLFSTAVVILGGLGIAALLERYLPSVYKIVTGAR